MAALTDDDIARMAKERVGFKVHVLTYVVVNLFLVLVWYVSSSGRSPVLLDGDGAYYWPFWAHAGWGLGLLFHAFGVYGGRGWQRKEEEKLRRKYGRAP